VGNAAGQSADRLHLLSLPQLGFQLLPLFLHLLALRDVSHECIVEGYLTVPGVNASGVDRDPEGIATPPAHLCFVAEYLTLTAQPYQQPQPLLGAAIQVRPDTANLPDHLFGGRESKHPGKGRIH